MRTITCAFVVAVLTAVLGVPLVAQQPAPQQAAVPSVTQGQLLRVDTTARTISVQTGADAPMVFSYTDQTKIVGADKGVAGLATMAGTGVKVTYLKRDKENVATEIEVRKKE